METPAKVCYLTSFNENLWNISGKTLLNSFSKSNVRGEMHVGFEHPCYNLETFPVKTFSIDNNPIYNKWFNEHKEIIPKQFGGLWDNCGCTKIRKVKVRDGSKHIIREHIFGCPGSRWNYNACRWFKKVITLNYFLENITTDILVWVDSDTHFINSIPKSFLLKLLDNYDSFCLYGNLREAVETGIIGFNFNLNGKELIKEWLLRFITNKFLEDHRWDDGYQYTVIMKSGKYKINDIVTDKTKTEVADFCRLSGYIKHRKGIHTRRYGIYPTSY